MQSEFENFFMLDFLLGGEKLNSFSIKILLISIPPKGIGFKSGITVTYIARVVTETLNMLPTSIA